MTALTPEERSLLNWECLLDRLELDVVRTEAMLDGHGAPEVDAWTPDEPGEPMPSSLLPRARALLERQDHLREQLETRLEGLRGQQQFTLKVERAAGRPMAVPRFVDVSA
ncbi:hypothetical protein [Nocardioides ferulae]|uniref:hypothetical protein n=1 Tax=Nocardioides ferulae TaxID=2340821 RepID=UPI000EAD9B33|nr:hypothetical protein [Nocardioides ferulae]